jgi:hypothetical protein
MQTYTPSWRGTPFQEGRRYLTLCADISLPPEQSPVAGEVVCYQQSWYSIYDNCSIYFFVNDAGLERNWRLHDSKPFEDWQKFFAAVGDSG